MTLSEYLASVIDDLAHIREKVAELEAERERGATEADIDLTEKE